MQDWSEAEQNLEELRKHGLFFNFVSDPFLPETIGLNTLAMRYCIIHSIPVIALTKQTRWVEDFIMEMDQNYIKNEVMAAIEDLQEAVKELTELTTGQKQIDFKDI
jgi:hypothetical protein